MAVFICAGVVDGEKRPATLPLRSTSLLSASSRYLRGRTTW